LSSSYSGFTVHIILDIKSISAQSVPMWAAFYSNNNPKPFLLGYVDLVVCAKTFITDSNYGM
jgi:hypothetical protein